MLGRAVTVRRGRSMLRTGVRGGVGRAAGSAETAVAAAGAGMEFVAETDTSSHPTDELPAGNAPRSSPHPSGITLRFRGAICWKGVRVHRLDRPAQAADPGTFWTRVHQPPDRGLRARHGGDPTRRIALEKLSTSTGIRHRSQDGFRLMRGWSGAMRGDGTLNEKKQHLDPCFIHYTLAERTWNGQINKHWCLT